MRGKWDDFMLMRASKSHRWGNRLNSLYGNEKCAVRRWKSSFWSFWVNKWKKEEKCNFKLIFLKIF